MADKTIRLQWGTSLELTYQLFQTRNEAAVNALITDDISGWTFKLLVKRSKADADSLAWVDVTGSVVSNTDKTFKFVLDGRHTTIPPGTWPAQILWWSGATTNPPKDGWSVDYTIEQAVNRLP